MSLTVAIEKSELSKLVESTDQLSTICRDQISADNQVFIFPLPGRMIELLKLLKAHKVEYNFRDYVLQG